MGATLNENIMWADVPVDVRKTFKGKKARRVLLKSKMQLFTLSRKSKANHESGQGVHELWSPYKPFKADPGYEGREQLASSSGKLSRREFFMATSASPRKKAAVRYAVVVKLQVPVWGFIGTIESVGLEAPSPKTISSIGKKILSAFSGSKKSVAPTSYTQIYIPGLEEFVSVRRMRSHDLFAD
ncbi:MAG: hypothetical protein P1V34_13020 [Alphaproteobacteria bacterium]|nr:hypothetical protein [Alphaproteobacteria bacterium]